MVKIRLIYTVFLSIHNIRDRSRTSGKGVHKYNGWGGSGVRIADFISFFLNIPCKCLSETKLFHFHGIFKNEFKQPPSGSATVHVLVDK